MGDDEPAGREAGLEAGQEAGQAPEVYYLWFLDSNSLGVGGASRGADGDDSGRGS